MLFRLLFRGTPPSERTDDLPEVPRRLLEFPEADLSGVTPPFVKKLYA